MNLKNLLLFAGLAWLMLALYANSIDNIDTSAVQTAQYQAQEAQARADEAQANAMQAQAEAAKADAMGDIAEVFDESLAIFFLGGSNWLIIIGFFSLAILLFKSKGGQR